MTAPVVPSLPPRRAVHIRLNTTFLRKLGEGEEDAVMLTDPSAELARPDPFETQAVPKRPITVVRASKHLPKIIRNAHDHAYLGCITFII